MLSLLLRVQLCQLLLADERCLVERILIPGNLRLEVLGLRAAAAVPASACVIISLAGNPVLRWLHCCCTTLPCVFFCGLILPFAWGVLALCSSPHELRTARHQGRSGTPLSAPDTCVNNVLDAFSPERRLSIIHLLRLVVLVALLANSRAAAP